MSDKELHLGSGHRKRLRERFLQSGFDGFLDYEIIELLLTLGTPRRDCKLIAKEAIREFGGLSNVLNASYDELQKIGGIGPSNAFGLKLFQAVSERLARERISQKIDLTSPGSVIEYIQKFIGNKDKEHFVVFYLDTQNRLIEDRIISIGTLNASLVHPREVFNPAVSLRAASIIVAHNHPSGNVEPSMEDREITKQLVQAGRLIGVEVKDHIIVSLNNSFSFQQQLIL